MQYSSTFFRINARYFKSTAELWCVVELLVRKKPYRGVSQHIFIFSYNSSLTTSISGGQLNSGWFCCCPPPPPHQSEWCEDDDEAKGGGGGGGISKAGGGRRRMLTSIWPRGEEEKEEDASLDISRGEEEEEKRVETAWPLYGWMDGWCLGWSVCLSDIWKQLMHFMENFLLEMMGGGGGTGG